VEQMLTRLLRGFWSRREHVADEDASTPVSALPSHDEAARQVIRSVLADRIGLDVVATLADDLTFAEAGIGSLDIVAVLYRLEEEHGWPVDEQVDIARELVSIEGMARRLALP
jgi:acyl carrier protein